MTKDDIERLSEKVESGIASEEELQQYNRLLDSYTQNNEIWDEDIYGNKDELELSIKKAIFEKTGIKKRVFKMEWFKWAAAAAVILMISAVSFYSMSNRSQKSQLAVVQPEKKTILKTDIAPGQSGAILTLATGEQILLDSAGNGSLAQQGNVSVVKKNGELVYSNGGNATDVVYNTMTTPKGRQFNLLLADGSKVWLNAASSITFPTAFIGKERKVTITGEAYFEVAHNASMPFIVEKGNTSVLVLGTHFNVNAYDDETALSVTLLEGSVNVRNGNNNNKIKPGQQAQIKEDGKISLLSDVDVNNIVAWKNGRISFQGANIEKVMRQMARWYDVEIVYNKKLDDLFYAEIPRTTMLSDVLKALELSRDVHFKIEGRKVIVIP
ncbi:MAG: FecR domain-containing protein [Ferruginibacter sp.]